MNAGAMPLLYGGLPPLFRILVVGGLGFLAALLLLRIGQPELLAAARKHGCGSLADVGAIVLERDGSLSVIRSSALGDSTALADLQA